MKGQETRRIQEQQFIRRIYNPWVCDHLERSIWKEDQRDTASRRFFRIQNVNEHGISNPVYIDQPMSESIEALNLSVRSYNCLKRCGIVTIEELMERITSEEDLLKIRNLGKKSAREILTKLEIYINSHGIETSPGQHETLRR